MPTTRAGMRARNGHCVEQPQRPRRADRLVGVEDLVDHPLLDDDLHPLGQRGSAACAALLHRCEMAGRHCARRRSGSASMLAAATASWTARLMPTPPTGDIAWAQSPMHRRPGRHQRSSRSTVTVSSLTRPSPAVRRPGRARNGAMLHDVARGRLRCRCCLQRGKPVLADDEGALPVVAAIERHQHVAAVDPAGGLRRVARAFSRAASTARRSARRDRRPRARPRSRTVECRPSAPTTRSARTSNGPSGVWPRTPATRPPSSIRSVDLGLHAQMKAGIAPARSRRENRGNPIAASAR